MKLFIHCESFDLDSIGRSLVGEIKGKCFYLHGTAPGFFIGEEKTPDGSDINYWSFMESRERLYN